MAAKELTKIQLDITRLVDVQDLLKNSHFLERNWLSLGLQLGLLKNTLEIVEEKHERDVSRCLLECLSLWLRRADKVDEKGGPTWDMLATALSKIGENTSVHNTRLKMKEEALQKLFMTLSQDLNNPVEISQLLFSEKCINEATLDVIETLEIPLDEKKATLLTAMHTADHKKLKVLATVLSKFHETERIYMGIVNEYVQTFPDDPDEDTVATVNTDEMSLEDRASDILRCHYGIISQSLHYPISVAQLLHGERLISELTLANIETCNQPVTLLLKSVRSTVHNNYQNVKVFASVLQRFNDNIHLGNAIMKDYDQSFDDGNKQMLKPFSNEVSPSYDRYKMQGEGIFVPRHMSTTFHSMRVKFGITFNKIRDAINDTSLTVKRLKYFLQDCYPELTPKLTCPSSDTIDGILDVVKEKCTLIDVCILEAIAERFDITKADIHIKAYKDTIDEFCQTVTVRLCLDESFEMSKSSSLKCETATFVLEWNPDETSLADIKNLLSIAFERLNKRVKVIVIREGNSITVTCTFSFGLTASLISKAQETLELVKKEGLIRMTIGYCIIYDRHKRNEKVEHIVEENTKDFKNQLELQPTMYQQKDGYGNEATRKKLHLASAETLGENDVLQDIITSLTLQLQERDEQIEKLKQSLRAVDNGKVEWFDFENRIILTSPSTNQCEEALSRLKEEQETEKEWNIFLTKSSPESTLVIISNLNEYIVKTLDIRNCLLSNACMSTLSEVFVKNETIKRLYIYSSQLNGGIKQFCNALLTNTSLERLVMWSVTLTDEDITHLSDVLASNKTLTGLTLSNCNITDNGIESVIKGLSQNQTLTFLNIGGNPLITSISASRIVELLNTTTSLKELRIFNTSLKDNDIELICTSLTSNSAIETLELSLQYEEICKKFACYQLIIDRLEFHIYEEIPW